MKNRKIFGAMLGKAALAAVLALVFFACNLEGDNGDNSSGVSFENFSAPSIWVDNKTGEKLVAFKGSLNPNTLISGIPAYATNHGLKKDPALFTATGDFALILITEKQYTDNKSNLSALENAPFARIYAFYNHEATNNNHFQISSKVGGSGRITLNNPTSWNIEIRKDGPTGEILGYVASQMTNTVLYVNAPDDYSLYPIFKKYVPAEKEIYEVVPKYTSGDLVGKPYAKDFAITTANGTAAWNLNEVSNNITFNLSSGSFYLRITNNSNTAVRFTVGDEEQVTSTGIKGIPPSTSNTYSIKFPRNPDGTYPESITRENLKIGTGQIMKTIPSREYKVDHLHEITVTGADASNLAIGSVSGGTLLNIGEMFGF
ncbi:hypothetical protein AGMMS50268_35250 [Spirochaetia bacterium]|nr:hypothetical protein AGMMS50268_35250 [Spirochaetia bacterium]